jgi:excisionase family DNA binding protein
MKTYDINEVADFLKVDRSTALDLANLGALPGAKVGRAWVFMEDELVGYLRDVTRKQTQVRRANAEAIHVMGQAQHEPKPVRRSRRRTVPNLPELGSQIAPAEVRVTP